MSPAKKTTRKAAPKKMTKKPSRKKNTTKKSPAKKKPAAKKAKKVAVAKATTQKATVAKAALAKATSSKATLAKATLAKATLAKATPAKAEAPDTEAVGKKAAKDGGAKKANEAKDKAKPGAGAKGEDSAKSLPKGKPVPLSDVPHEKYGLKFECFACNTKFYEMGRPEPVCPKCGADQRDRPKDDPKPSPKPKRATIRPMSPLLDDDEEVAASPEDGGLKTPVEDMFDDVDIESDVELDEDDKGDL